MTKMKLYVDARLPWGSGIGRYVASILPEMVDARPDWQFVIGTHQGNSNAALSNLAKSDNVIVRELRAAPFSLDEQLHLERQIGPVTLSWFTNYWVPFGWRGRYVATVHDLLHLRPELFPASKPKRLASKLMLKIVRRRASSIIFVSDFSRREFIDLIGPPRSGVVVHHGSDHFPCAPVPFGKKPVALIVGAHKLHKNMALAINAWGAANPPAPWKLVVVSPGDDLRSSVELGASAGSVSFQSGLSNEALVNLYREASLVLFPTKYEGFGFPLIEAALNGARILSSTADALREVGRDMDVAFLDPDDKSAWINAISETVKMPLPCHEDAAIVNNIGAAESYRWELAAIQTLGILERERLKR